MTVQKINREELLRQLTSVSPGLATKAMIEQSSCFVFINGQVVTFNDEICCRAKSPIAAEGAIKAEALLKILAKLPEETLDVTNGEGALIFKGKGRKTTAVMEASIELPVNEVSQPDEWQKMPAQLADAVNIVRHAASSDASAFWSTCIHISPEYLEACDNFRLARYNLKTGLDSSILVRAQSLKHVVGLDMTEWAWDDNWLHFRNPSGLMMSCRLYLDDYPTEEFTEWLKVDGEHTTLPGGLSEAVERAEIFSVENVEANQVQVDLREGRMRITGTGASGKFEEIKQADYKGDPISFLIAPKLLVDISARASDCEVAPGRLKITTPNFVYLSCLGEVG